MKIININKYSDTGGHTFHTEGNRLVSYEGPGGSITVPEGVTCICGEAFAFCDHVTGVILPEGVTEIGDLAFYRSGIETVSLPETLTRIGKMAFAETMLKSVNISDNVYYVADFAFYGAAKLKKVRLPKKLDSIEPNTFRNCVSLEEIELPSNLKYIQGGAFMGCASLENIAFPDGLAVVWEKAFCGCGSLKEVCLGNSMKALGKDAFKDCVSLETVNLPTGLDMTYGDPFAGTEFSAGDSLPETERKEPGAEEKPDGKYAEAAADDPSIGTGTNNSPGLTPNIWQYFDRLSREDRVRELTHFFAAKGEIDGVGWASVRIELDGEWARFRISYVGSSIGAFRSFANEIGDGESGRFAWESEPGCYPWSIQRRGGVFYVRAPRIPKPFFISRDEFLNAVSGMTAEW